jgi:hypothetical protein
MAHLVHDPTLRLDRHAEAIRMLTEMFPDEPLTLHERRCKITRKGRCTCEVIVVQPTARA